MKSTMNAKPDVYKRQVMVGDQLFTDVVGAHLIGMPAYLVAPLVDVDLKHTQLVRKVEGLFLKEPAPQSGICLQDDRRCV